MPSNKQKTSQTTLAQLAQQSEIHRGNVQARLSQQHTSHTSTKNPTPLETKEARLLRFYRIKGQEKGSNPWRLSNITHKGMPQCTEASTRLWSNPKIVHEITAVMGQRGIKNGWSIYDIDEAGPDGSLQYVDVLVGKMNTGIKGDEMKGDGMKGDGMKGDEVKGDGMKGEEMQVESETTSEGILTPGTSVVDGQ